MIAFEVKGIETVNAKLRALADATPALAAIALNEVAEETMTDAKNRTPVEFGTLRRSGKVSEYATPATLAAQLSFGTEYAIYVHERVELRHTVGEAKFLERAVLFTARFFEARIANTLRAGYVGAGSPGGVGHL